MSTTAGSPRDPAGGGEPVAGVSAPPARREPLIRFWLLGLATVVLVAVVVGLVVHQFARPKGEDGDAWGELGAALDAFALGVLACVVAWLVLLVVYVRRYLVAGNRLAAAGISVGAVLACAAALAALVAVLVAAVGRAGAGNPGAWALLGGVWGAALAGVAAPPVVVERLRGPVRG